MWMSWRRWRTALTCLAAAATLTASPARAIAPSTTPPATHEGPAPGSPEFARLVLSRLDDMHRGTSSHARMSMTVVTRHWTRTMAMEAWSKGTERSLVRILSPQKERGTATLMVGNDMFTYLSKTDRTVKISGGMMGGSWMGSHFTNDDLVRASRLSDDYEAALSGQGALQGTPVFQLTLIPRPDAAVVWGKVVVTVRQSDLLPVGQVFHDEDGAAVKSLSFADFREVNGRVIPFQMKMLPLDEPGEFTQVTYELLDFEVPLQDDFFSVQSLRAM